MCTLVPPARLPPPSLTPHAARDAALPRARAQGESNVAQNSGTKDSKFKGYYACLFRSKVQAWRKQFESPSMFYGFVSLAAYGEADASPAVRTSDALPFMRMDQNSVLALDTTGVALALDLGDDGKVPFTPPSSRHGGIHPRNKTEVARRMALEYGRVALGLSMVSQGGRGRVSRQRAEPFPCA